MTETFQEIFTALPQVMSEAHGRVNLIGEHTDYNGGFVLPTCIRQATQVFLSARADKTVRVLSQNMSMTKDGFSQYELGTEEKTNQWLDYVKAVTWLIKKKGFAITGFDAMISSDVPIGSGLSSSAALLVGIFKGLNELFQLKLDALTIAKFAQQSENEFVGARVGIMDQMAASLGRQNEAIFIDTRSLEYKLLPLNKNEIELLVINSGITHSNAHGSYNQRRQECEIASKLLGVRELRDADILKIEKSDLPEPIKSRARHVVTENNRVLAAVNALENKDYEKLGSLFYESQNSMRDDYEISTPEIDFLISIIAVDENVYGCRLTGAGWGGSLVAIVRPGTAFKVAEKVLPQYRQKTGRVASLVIP